MGLFGSTARTPLDVMAMGQTPQQQNALPNYWDVIQAPAQNVQPQGAQGVQPHFFGKGGMGSKIGVGILGGLADGLAQWGGAPPGYRNAMQAKQEYEQRQQELQAARDARMEERFTPHAQQVGDSIGMLDPSTGAFTPTYTAPQQEQVPEVVRRITAAGIDPNSEQGRRLIIGSITNSPDAIAAQTALADHRFGNSMTLKQTAPGRSGGGGGGGTIKATAVGPNGERVGWNGHAWVRM